MSCTKAPVRPVIAALVAAAAVAWSPPTRAERAVSPTDALPAGAIEVTASAEAHTRQRGSFEYTIAALGGRVRVWPGHGLWFGLTQSLADIDEDDEQRAGVESAGRTDLQLSAGIVRSVTTSLVVGADMRVELPTGAPFYSNRRTDVALRGLVGFRFTPRWDFYLQPLVGVRRGEPGDQATGNRVGFHAGLVYQRSRVSLLASAFNVGHDEVLRRRSTGAEFEFAVEFTPGAAFGIEVMFASGDDRVSAILYTLTLVGHVSGRSNELRSEDPKRGEAWRWWIPPPVQ